MPLVITILLALSGLAHGHTLLTSVKKVDPLVGQKGGAAEERFLFWSAPRWNSYTETETCDFTFFAVSSRRVEIVTNGAFAIDTSLTVDRKVKVGYKTTRHVAFLDPETGELLARRSAAVWCRGRVGAETVSISAASASELGGIP